MKFSHEEDSLNIMKEILSKYGIPVTDSPNPVRTPYKVRLENGDVVDGKDFCLFDRRYTVNSEGKMLKDLIPIEKEKIPGKVIETFISRSSWVIKKSLPKKTECFYKCTHYGEEEYVYTQKESLKYSETA